MSVAWVAFPHGVTILAARARRSSPLAGLALSIGLATTLLEPCLAAAGLPGIGALLAASMAALFAVLLAIVSLSVAKAIAAMLLRPVAGAAPSPPLYRPRVASPGAGGLVIAILSVRRRDGRYGTAGPPGAGASPPAATLASSSRDPP